jgi:hypothetical protein
MYIEELHRPRVRWAAVLVACDAETVIEDR